MLKNYLRDEMTGWYCCCYFPPTVRPFVGLYDIELGDQELHNSYPLTFYGLMGCTLCPRRESNRWPQRFSVDRQHSAALGSVFATHGMNPVRAAAHGTARQIHTRWKRGQEAAFQGGGETRRGGVKPPAETNPPKCHEGGGTSSPWKPSLSNIWCWSAARLWWGQGGWRMEVDEFDRSSGKEPKRRKMKRNERERKKNTLRWNKF